MKDLFEIETKVTMTARASNLPKISKEITGRLGKFVDTLLPVLEKVAKEYITGEKEDDK